MESNTKKFKRETKLEAQRAYKLAHQTLCIKTISFDKRSLFGYVELTIHPLQPDLRRIKVNSKQCKIYHIAVNEKWEAKFLYNDPTMEICQEDGKQRNLDFFQNCHLNAMTAVNADSGNGEITIKLPVETFAAISDLQPIKINIEFSLEQPKGGVHFVVPEGEGDLADRGAHMFTYGHENSSRLWFPCVDSFSECCTWKLELTCDLNMTAVSCGDLIEVLYTSDRRRKTYHYFVPIPTSAPSIAMAVGPFETLVDPNMHEVTHFCLPHLKEVLKHTTSYIHEAFEFYEEMLASRYPYSCYKQVFVDESYADVCPYATMTIFSTNLLHSARIIEQTILTRKAMASAVAKQFFGCFITMQSWSDNWLIKGISNYLSSLYVKKTFGNNEYRFLISEILNEITTYEHRVGGILLDTSVKDSNHHFSIRNSHTVSPYYTEVFEKKALLIMRMLEIRIGSQLLIQVINKMLSLAYSAASQKYGVNAWTNLKLSTSSFVKLVMTVTGKDIQPFLDLWVRQTGCARFLGTSVFNRKRNVVELELKQDLVAKGALKYVGPLTVTIQELDGSFNHTFKIEENKTKFDITCHSKSRRNKKKKIPLMTGEEVDMDLSAMDADSPVLWLRIDPDMNLLSHVTWEQPDFMWQYQLRFERDVVAQKEAISALENFPTSATRKALTDILEHEHCFYRVRMASCHCLAKVANSMLGNWNGPPAMITIFRKLFGSHSCPNIVRQNNFSNFQHYFLYKTIPVTMAKLRNIHTICPAEVFRFILDLFKYNDNSRNKFSDNYYRASLIDALASTVTPAITVGLGTGPTVESLSADVKIVLEEVVRYLNLDKLLPCYRLTVTNSCLRALRILQKFGHIPCSSEVYKSYMQHGVFRDVRIVAAEMLVDFIKTESKQEDLDFLLDMVENDQDVYFRHETLRKLIQNPPFKKMEHSVLHTQQLVERLWKLMNSSLSYDSRLRCDVADLYFILYGRNRPTCLGIPDSLVVLNLKDKNKFNPSVVSEEMQEMFEDDEDDVETDNVAMDTEDVEVDVMDAGTASVEEDAYRFTDEPEISLGGLHKRKASSPLDFKSSLGPDSNIVAEAVQNEDSNTSMKFKFKVKQEEESLATTTPAAASFLDVSVSGRLSEDSASPPHPESKPEMVAPMSFAGLIPSSASTSTLDALGAQAEDGTNSKSHKAKKKKKKNKHKHKHKHKHDKPDKEHGTLERVKESGHSSGTSTVNSPIVRHEGPISSPEFEVM